MKNKIYTVFISIIAVFINVHFAFSENIPNLITEVKVFDNDSTYKFNYLYDSEKNKVLETKSFLNADSWVYLSQIEWVYENSSCTKQIQRKWKQSNWIDESIIENFDVQDVKTELFSNYINGIKVNFKKTVKQYSDKKLISKNDYVFNADNWQLTSTQSFHYNISSLLDSSLIFVNNSLDSIVKYRFLYVYNADSSLNSQLTQIAGNQSELKNSIMTYWYYKPGTKLVSTVRSKSWNSKILKWENSNMIENDYDTLQNLKSEIYYTWNEMFWTNNLKYNYQYDSLKHISKKELAFPIYREWRNTRSINYNEINEDNNQIIESVLGFWGGKTGELISDFVPYVFNNETVIQRAKKISVNYSSSNTTNNNLITNLKGLINVFPNPSDGIFYINLKVYNIDSWKVSDMSGKILKQQNNIQNSGVVDITDLARGIYILSANASGKTLYQKISKL